MGRAKADKAIAKVIHKIKSELEKSAKRMENFFMAGLGLCKTGEITSEEIKQYGSTQESRYQTP